MSNLILKTFAKCKKEKRPALLTYTVAGDNTQKNSLNIIQNISNHIKDKLYETNLLRKKNDLIPYAKMDRTFLINKVKVLNHRWVVADFSDGTYWGEIFLTYQIDKNGGLDFELKEHFIYPNPD